MTRDLSSEVPLVLLKDIPKLSVIPPRRNGGRLHLRTGFRWAGRGLSGVRLETVLVGGQRYTSVPALQRFFEAVTAVRRLLGVGGDLPAARRDRHDVIEVTAELDRLGL